MNRALLLALLGQLACSDEKGPRAAESCGESERVELRSWMATLCTEPRLLDVEPLALVPWTEREELDDPLSIEIDPQALRVDGESTAPGLELRTRLHEVVAERRAAAERSGRAYDPRFVLAIHRDTPLRRVGEVARDLADVEILRGWLAFGSSTLPRTPPPRDPEIYARAVAEVEAAPPAERAVRLAEKVEAIAAPCPAMKAAFDVVVDDPAKRCERLMDAVANALVDCGCPAWQPELIARMQLLGPADTAALVTNTVELTPAKPERATPDTTWAAFVASHSAPMRTLWLELAP